MALFSDIDWIIIFAVGAFLLLGGQGAPFLRQLGRWYGRLLRLKAELVGEMTSSAGLPALPRGPSSLRAALLGVEPAGPPAGAPTPPPVPVPPAWLTQATAVNVRAVETWAYGAAMGPGVWSVATTSVPGEVVRLR